VLHKPPSMPHPAGVRNAASAAARAARPCVQAEPPRRAVLLGSRFAMAGSVMQQGGKGQSQFPVQDFDADSVEDRQSGNPRSHGQEPQCQSLVPPNNETNHSSRQNAMDCRLINA